MLSGIKFIEFIHKLGYLIVVGGDYNAKHPYWESGLITYKERAYYKSANFYKVNIISIGRPTYWTTDPYNISDILKFFVTKRIFDVLFL